ncbi:MarR family winged helix-turn-helix transcriptional regulator [Leifsonia sp. NCR5]|uniref:MarR family winged helix-turn-helix transcriptional regulator n=1 Tax=Leifsonia sp. NCR5 TaxID=1978342 RepID=UPI000A19AEAF|nr:MarR family transcriptional regulator [Leifsonia sp. NCR5]
MAVDEVPGTTPGLPYRSGQLAALLEVFALWSSGAFIRGLAGRVGVELDTTAIVAITLLARDGEQRASTLASRLHVGASAISKLSARLGAHGLVEKRDDPEDSRATLLRLTEDGTAAANALVDAGDAMMADLLQTWPDRDRDDFRRLLQRFRDEAVAYAAGVSDPAATTARPPQTDTPASPEKEEK